MKKDTFRIIAHRGTSLLAPENTLSAFQTAIDMGATEVETDVQLTMDNHLVLCHDETLRRYGNGDSRVEALNFSDLAEMDFGTWFSPVFQGERIVCLEELLRKWGKSLTYHIELKGSNPELPLHVLQSLEASGMLESCIITSFSLSMLQRFRDLAPQARLGWLIKSIEPDTLHTAEKLSLFQLCPQAAHLTHEGIVRGLEYVPEIRAWGCPRNREEAQQTAISLKQAGCGGITVDNPQWLLDISEIL
jgi:glycerophosphoryl diester phosphodiesterase